jgi:hypothetical protein
MPSAFISYSWEDDAHRAWVKDLAARLREDGVETTLDQWEVAPGDQLPAFMERAIRSNDYVLIICTPRYKQRFDQRQGGVGYEGDIMTAEVLTNANHQKFVPIFRKGAWAQVAPTALQGKYFIDLSATPYSEENYGDLVVTLHGVRAIAPPVGKPFSTVQKPTNISTAPSADLADEIRIQGVIADKVTTPRMDGTAGSALYRVPFRLSRSPDWEWAELFIESWNHPPSYTSMHRPGIARVEGDTVVLGGTTLEEVKRYHRDTLKLALAETNRKYNVIQSQRRLAEERERVREETHRREVADKAGDITFD